MSIGLGEILLIALVVVLLFGATRLPEIGRSIGAGWRDFKRGLDGSHSRREDPEKPDDTEKPEDRR